MSEDHFSEERLVLPGSRSVWWGLASAAVVLPLVLLFVSSLVESPVSLSAVDFELRKLNLMWRVTSASAEELATSRAAQLKAERSKSPKSRNSVGLPRSVSPGTDVSLVGRDALMGGGSVGAGSSAPAGSEGSGGLGALQAQMDVGHREAISLLFEEALKVPVGDAEVSAAELVVAHAIATDHLKLARKLGARLERASADIAAALVVLGPGASDPRRHAEELRAASELAQSSRFGDRWGNFTRDRVRALIHRLAGRFDRARAVHRRLNDNDDTVLALVRTLWTVLFFAGIFGSLSLLGLLVRVRVRRARGEPWTAALRQRFSGLGSGRAYHGDPLVVVLGFAVWLLGYVFAGLLASMIPGPRSSGGLAVLFQGLAGVILAWAVITFFSRVRPPIDAARFLGGSDVPAWRASTTSLWAYCLLLPVMLPVMMISALMAGEQIQGHPVVEMMLQGLDAIQLISLGLSVAVVAPIGEELLFRGFLYRVLRQHLGWKRGLLISSALFALLHMAPAQLLPYMVLGLSFGLVFEWVGSLWASIVLHGLWNAVVFVGVVMVALS